MKRNAFTLIELLVVIAIIALLLSIMLPGLGKAKQKAQEVVCRSNLKQWGVYWTAYTQDNNGEFSSGIPEFAGGSPRGQWAQAILPYIGEKTQLFICPSAKKEPITSSNPQYGSATETCKVKAYNLSDDIEVKRGSYGANVWMYHTKITLQKRPAEEHWGKIATVKSSYNVPLMLDAAYVGGGPMRGDDNDVTSERIMPPAEEDFDRNAGGYEANFDMAHFVINRHNKKINGLFMDMSAEPVGLKRLWRLKWSRNYNPNGRVPDWNAQAPWMASYPDD